MPDKSEQLLLLSVSNANWFCLPCSLNGWRRALGMFKKSERELQKLRKRNSAKLSAILFRSEGARRITKSVILTTQWKIEPVSTF